MDDCIFCKIIRLELPSKIEAETEEVIAFRSIAPVASTHILIVPKKHISNFMNIAEDDDKLFSELIKVSQILIKDKKIEGGYKLVINGGKYQSINHFHWHLIAGNLEKEDVLNKT